MMRVLMAQVYNPKNEAFTEIGLPASYEEMKDTLQILHGANEECTADIQEFLGKVNPLNNNMIYPCSLYELNYFATLFSEMQEYEKQQFIGLLECSESECTEMKEIINVALNTPKLDCYHAPATTDEDLGQFCIENELLPQLSDLEGLTDEQYEWICKHLDEEKIGQEMREQEKGVFTSVGYFVKNEEIKQLYDGEPPLPQPADYVFRLELAQIPDGGQPNDNHTVSLKLPASEIEIAAALQEIGAESIYDCCFYGYESVIVPQLSDCYGDNDDFYILNEFAKEITKLDDDSIVLYKAMLEAVQCGNFETAVSVYGKMEKFTLEKNCISPSDYADKALESLDIPVKEELNFYLSKEGYGRSLMQHDGVDRTSYGMLIPMDGIKLSEQIQKQQTSMEMTMSM